MLKETLSEETTNHKSEAQESGMGEYIRMCPKEATAGIAAFAQQFESKTFLFCLSDWEVHSKLEQQ
jgi:hypothetical protein